MSATLVESNRWTVVVPLPVIMELAVLPSNVSQLGEAAQNAMLYMTTHIKSHSTSLKVQTSKGNYLVTLNVFTEDVDFTASGNSADRTMDDLILKAAIWHEEHWVDRNELLKADPAVTDDANPAKVVLLSLDRNCKPFTHSSLH
jgi:predicted ribonuclease YlaK